MAMPQTSAISASLEKWLGLRLESEFEQHAAVERGIPTGVIQQLLRQGLTKEEVFGTVIPERTLKHRRVQHTPLTSTESDRVLRLARSLAQAESVFGDPEKALRWMRHSLHRFGGKTPLQMVATETGGRLVEEMLIQIDEGLYA